MFNTKFICKGWVDSPSPCVFARGYQMLTNRQIIRVDAPPPQRFEGLRILGTGASHSPISTKGCHYLNVSPANLQSVPSTFLPNKFAEGTRQTFPFVACSWSCCDKSLKMYPWMIPYSLAAYVQLRSYARGYEPWRKTSGNSPGRSLTLPSPKHPISTASWWSAGAWIIQLQLARLAKPKPQWDCCWVRTGARNGLTFMVCFSGVM